MLTGRITYGLGQYDPSTPVAGAGIFNTPISQLSAVQTPIGQWGAGEIATAVIAAFVVYSVFFTTKRGVSTGREKLARRRKRLSEQYEAAAKHYRA